MPTLRDSLSAQSGSNPLTLTGITPAGTNRYGIVKVSFFEARTIDSVTWGGTNITANVIKNAAHDGAGRKVMAMFYYLDPPAAAADVVVTLSGGSTFDLFVEAEAWDGVDQTTPYENLTFTADGEGQTASPALLTVASATGDVVNDFFYQWAFASPPPNVAAGAGQTEIQVQDAASANGAAMGASYEAGAASVDMTWTGDIGTWAMYAVSLNAAAGGGTDTPLAVDKGDLTLTGNSIALAVAMPVTNAGLTLSGQDVALIAAQSVSLAVEASALSLVGRDVGLVSSMPSAEQPSFGNWGQMPRRKRRRRGLTVAEFIEQERRRREAANKVAEQGTPAVDQAALQAQLEQQALATLTRNIPSVRAIALQAEHKREQEIEQREAALIAAYTLLLMTANG